MQALRKLAHFGSLDEVFPLVIRLLKLFRAWGDRRRLFGLYGLFFCHIFLRLLPVIAYLDTSDIHTLIRQFGELVFVAMMYPPFIAYVWKLPKLMLLIDTLKTTFAECRIILLMNFKYKVI